MIFNRKYFFWALLLFLIEILIALFVHDAFVRPYVGDFLVVILLYCAFRTVLKNSVFTVALAVLVIAYGIEVMQYFHFIKWIGWEHNVLVRTILGYGFSWWDMLAYTLGFLAIVLVEKINR